MQTNFDAQTYDPEDIAEMMNGGREIPPVIQAVIARIAGERAATSVVYPYEVFETMPNDHVRPFNKP